MTRDTQAMPIPEIQQPVAYLKETEKAQRELTEPLEQLVHERELRAIERVVRKMAKAGLPFYQIVDLTDTPADKVQKVMDDIATGIQAQLS